MAAGSCNGASGVCEVTRGAVTYREKAALSVTVRNNAGVRKLNLRAQFLTENGEAGSMCDLGTVRLFGGDTNFVDADVNFKKVLKGAAKSVFNGVRFTAALPGVAENSVDLSILAKVSKKAPKQSKVKKAIRSTCKRLKRHFNTFSY